MENKVFLSDKKDGPAIESTTIFLDDQVYDYLKTPEEITVLDRHEGGSSFSIRCGESARSWQPAS